MHTTINDVINGVIEITINGKTKEDINDLNSFAEELWMKNDCDPNIQIHSIDSCLNEKFPYYFQIQFAALPKYIQMANDIICQSHKLIDGKSYNPMCLKFEELHPTNDDILVVSVDIKNPYSSSSDQLKVLSQLRKELEKKYSDAVVVIVPDNIKIDILTKNNIHEIISRMNPDFRNALREYFLN